MNVYTVEIRYRESQYELRHGPREHPYRWTYRITASEAALATRLALSEFRSITAMSSVSWLREIVEITTVACSTA